MYKKLYDLPHSLNHSTERLGAGPIECEPEMSAECEPEDSPNKSENEVEPEITGEDTNSKKNKIPPFEVFYVIVPKIIDKLRMNFKCHQPINPQLKALHHYIGYNANINTFLSLKLLKHNVLSILCDVWDHYWSNNYFYQETAEAGEWTNCMNSVTSVCLGMSDTGPDCSKAILSVGLFSRFLASLGPDKICMNTCLDNRRKRHLGGNILGILYNCLRRCQYEAKPVFRANGGIEKMMQIKLLKEDPANSSRFEDSSFSCWWVFSFLCMVYIHEENDENMIGEELTLNALNYLCHQACKAVEIENRFFEEMALTEYIEAINILLVSDKNKEKVCQQPEVFNCLVKAITTNDSDDEDELIALIRCLYLLTFIAEGKKMLKENSQFIAELDKLKHHKNNSVRQNAEGTLWNLSGQRPSTAPARNKRSGELSQHQQHVMISYDWNHQKIATAINLELKQLGYMTWMDIDRMRGSTLEAMAMAVEQSAVILVCFSERYKNSPNCRKEAEYAVSLQKSLIPIKTDRDYRADGWLGIMLGTTLWFECNSEDSVTSIIPKLAKELGNRGKIGETPTHAYSKDDRTKNRTSIDKLSTLTSEEVKLRFEKIGWDLPIENITGAALLCLHDLLQQSTIEFHRTLREELGLTDWLTRLKFAKCIKQLDNIV